MNTTEIPIEQRYGYHIIATDEDKNKFSPKRTTDEFFIDCVPIWSGVSNDGLFSPKNTYRRKIDVGEGYELVGLDEVGNKRDEWTTGGGVWTQAILFTEGRTIRSAITDASAYEGFAGKPILAFRRRKAVQETKSDCFWMVRLVGRREPCYRHGTYDGAVKEAERLSIGESQSATVLECKEVARVDFVPASTKVTKL